MLDHLDINPFLAVTMGVALLVPTLWLAWRQPTMAFLVALAALAVRPEAMFGGAEVGTEWGIQRTLLVLALVVNALKYGVRLTINWPILALVAVLVMSSLLGELHPKLTFTYMLLCLVVLALPWSFTQVVLAPGSRRQYAMAIAIAPLISVAVGVLWQIAGLRPLLHHYDGYYRLQGAVGIPADLALLAFAGFAVALHEFTRPRRAYVGYLLVANLIILILTGTRTAILAAAVLALTYAWLSDDLRRRLQDHRRKVLAGAAVVAAVLLAYLPSLILRFLEGPSGWIALSGRDQLWPFYYQEFLFSPAFGRGLGAGFTAAVDWLRFALPMPHNEYLHLLVIGGISGFILCMTAIVLWFRQLWQMASANDRPLIQAVIPALALYAVTDNVITLPSILGLYVYFDVLLTRRATSSTRSRTPRRERSRRTKQPAIEVLPPLLEHDREP